MGNNQNGSVNWLGVGFLGLLQIAFIVLKLVGVIDWGWGLVFFPLIISASFFVVSVIVFTVWTIWVARKY